MAKFSDLSLRAQRELMEEYRNKGINDLSDMIADYEKEVPSDTTSSGTSVSVPFSLAETYRNGGKIHIKPSKRGTFTAAATKHGKSVQAFASQVLAHPENYSTAMRKKANFARNAAKWHAEGGPIDVFRKLTAPTYDTPSFSDAFGQARQEGKSYFKWNGKRYNTRLNTEVFQESNPFNYEEGYSLIDAARRIREVENSKDNPKGGYDSSTGRWYPHRSHEGGADTVAYGIKLSNGTPEAALARQQGYLTDAQANEAVDSLVRTYGDSAKKVYNKKFGEGAWDDLSEKSKSILIDYEYNPGLSKFPNLMTGFHDADLEKIKANYKRYSRGKELGRNKTLARDIDSLSTFYPILGK
jgi:hypothetical protein